MKALVCVAPNDFEYEQREMVTPARDSAILKIQRIGICGTDLHAFEGTQPYFNYPRVLGHELSAIVVDNGGATDFAEGDLVTFVPYFSCGKCIACRNGKPNCCVSMNVCGVHSDGGMTEYLSVPSSSLVHGNGLDAESLALIEPLAIGRHGVRRADVKPGEFVLIVGAGPIGLALMEFVRLAGGKVIALDVNDFRLEFCRATLGIEHVINAGSGDVSGQINRITKGDMPTVVFDATGNLKAILDSFKYMAHGGRYVLVGLQKGEIQFSHPEFHKREGALMSSRNATRDDFEFVVRSIKEERLNPRRFITHRVSFDRIKNEFGKWLNPDNHVIKAMVTLS